jgi:hypothetical protein
MAIDGIKIIDSDLANDVYNEFMDLYDANMDLSEIKSKIDLWRNAELDALEYEIFISTYALALWETGFLTNNIINEVNQVLAEGQSLQMWVELTSEVEGETRRKELKKLLKKISTPKVNPRKRKRYGIVTRFLFEDDVIVAFQMPNGSYRAAIMFGISQYRGNCNYNFTPTAYSNHQFPTEADIIRGSVFIHKIGNMYERSEVIKEQPGIELFWQRDKKFAIPFTVGLPIYAIEHNDLIKIKERFTVIGRATIKKSFKKLGSIGYEDNYEQFTHRFTDVVDYNVRIFKNEMIDLKMILDE